MAKKVTARPARHLNEDENTDGPGQSAVQNPIVLIMLPQMGINSTIATMWQTVAIVSSSESKETLPVARLIEHAKYRCANGNEGIPTKTELRCNSPIPFFCCDVEDQPVPLLLRRGGNEIPTNMKPQQVGREWVIATIASRQEQRSVDR